MRLIYFDKDPFENRVLLTSSLQNYQHCEQTQAYSKISPCSHNFIHTRLHIKQIRMGVRPSPTLLSKQPEVQQEEHLKRAIGYLLEVMMLWFVNSLTSFVVGFELSRATEEMRSDS